jgi:hypothetical protein
VRWLRQPQVDSYGLRLVSSKQGNKRFRNDNMFDRDAAKINIGQIVLCAASSVIPNLRDKMHACGTRTSGLEKLKRLNIVLVRENEAKTLRDVFFPFMISLLEESFRPSSVSVLVNSPSSSDFFVLSNEELQTSSFHGPIITLRFNGLRLEAPPHP